MPVIVTKDSTEYYLVPAPLVTFNKQIYNNIGRPGFGADYSVSLQGTLIQTHGNPFYSGGSGGLSNDEWTTTSTVEPNEITEVSGLDRLNATIRKQELIRSLFSNPVVSGIAKPIKVQIKGWNTTEAGQDPGSGILFYGFVDDVSFDSDGRWANPGSYTVNLRTSSFTDSANNGLFDNANENVQSGYFISNLTDTFDIQEDGRTTLTFSNISSNQQKLQQINKVYAVNRSISAIGLPIYNDEGSYKDNLAPWQQASGFIHQYLNVGSGNLNNFTSIKTSGVFQSVSGNYNTANFVYQESIDKEAGSYSITETFILYSGTHPILETVSINKDTNENGVVSVSVQGNIEGLNTLNGFDVSGNKYLNANSYFTGVIETGNFSPPYYYAKGILSTGNIWLHPVPLNKSVARDLNAGTISYTYNYDDRPPNIVPGSISESIQINDTYPGEIFSVTPVIGRSQPVLQYLNSRSEYKRSLSINITMANTGRPLYDNYLNQINDSGTLTSNQHAVLQNLFFARKPSISNTAELNLIYQAANPANDPNFNIANGKCYHSAPNESWDPRTRNYSYNVEWTYERITGDI